MLGAAGRPEPKSRAASWFQSRAGVPRVSNARSVKPLQEVVAPILQTFLFPVRVREVPSCIRHRPFLIAGDWHGLRRVSRARHRVVRYMGKWLRHGWMALRLGVSIRPKGG
jgi:hypothetical protein